VLLRFDQRKNEQNVFYSFHLKSCLERSTSVEAFVGSVKSYIAFAGYSRVPNKRGVWNKRVGLEKFSKLHKRGVGIKMSWVEKDRKIKRGGRLLGIREYAKSYMSVFFQDSAIFFLSFGMRIGFYASACLFTLTTPSVAMGTFSLLRYRRMTNHKIAISIVNKKRMDRI